ncbi:hypothetical protein ACSVDE_01380 [Pseudalkalibacillus sp. Hm43]|uniref:hypothetical protein n=1 Tax=Pseudalkalibacillus sp. Hm43 TaxID=3450742 RepID=UPI001CF9D231
MKSEEARLRDIQAMAYHVMDDLHLNETSRSEKDLRAALDHMARAVGMLSDPDRNVTLNYVEEKVTLAYQLVVKKKKSKKRIKVQ